MVTVVTQQRPATGRGAVLPSPSPAGFNSHGRLKTLKMGILSGLPEMNRIGWENEQRVLGGTTSEAPPPAYLSDDCRVLSAIQGGSGSQCAAKRARPPAASHSPSAHPPYLHGSDFAWDGTESKNGISKNDISQPPSEPATRRNYG